MGGARAGVFLALAVCTAGCGGNNGPAPFPVESAYNTAVIQTLSNVCTTTYTVHRDGSAQRATQSCGGGTKTLTLPTAIVSNLFNDLAAAQPLASLQSCLTVDTATTVSWNGQQSPNIVTPCGSAAEQTLSQQLSTVITAFEPVP